MNYVFDLELSARGLRLNRFLHYQAGDKEKRGLSLILSHSKSATAIAVVIGR